jgi:hypothetical protein
VNLRAAEELEILERKVVMIDTVRQQQLLTQGFCHFPNVLDQEVLGELVRVTDGLLDAEPAERHQKYRYQGSNINVAYQDPVFARLFAWPKTMGALASLGYDDPKWWSGYLLSKPPLGPPLYWHQDWWAWDHVRSADPHLLQAFLMYYLTDTTRENGCLRVIPGSHARRVDLHDKDYATKPLGGSIIAGSSDCPKETLS